MRFQLLRISSAITWELRDEFRELENSQSKRRPFTVRQGPIKEQADSRLAIRLCFVYQNLVAENNNVFAALRCKQIG